MQTSNILIWINKDLLSSTAFSTSLRKMKRRLRVFQYFLETDNPELIFIQKIILHEKTNKWTYCFLKRK